MHYIFIHYIIYLFKLKGIHIRYYIICIIKYYIHYMFLNIIHIIQILYIIYFNLNHLVYSLDGKLAEVIGKSKNLVKSASSSLNVEVNLLLSNISQSRGI